MRSCDADSSTFLRYYCCILLSPAFILADIESLSSDTDDDDDDDDSNASDSDFFVVPIPDFFNPELPASRTASTKIIINKGKLAARAALHSHTICSATFRYR